MEAYPGFDFESDDDYTSEYYGDYNYLPDVHIAAKVVLAVILIFVITVCGFGNSLLCFTILRLKRLRTVTNLFIASLAISDAVVALFCVPFSLYYYLVHDWIFGGGMCVFVGTLKVVSLYVSVNTLLAIAIERYYVIFHPLKPRLQKVAVLVISVVIWIVSFVIAIPTPMHMEFSSGRDKQFQMIHFCGEYWADRVASRAYLLLLSILEYMLPMLIMIVAYFSIIRKVWLRRALSYSSHHHQQHQQELTSDPKKKTIRMLATVVVAFGICWGPYHIYSIIVHFNEEILMQVHNDMTVFYIVECLAMANSVVNTVVFFLFNDTYRKECWEMMKTLTGSNKASKGRGIGNVNSVRTSGTRVSASSSVWTKSSRSTKI
ncbi:prokineticin receptor 2-like [Glandiceps talaboti]